MSVLRSSRVIMSPKMGPERTEQGQQQQRCHRCHRFIALGRAREEMAGGRVSSAGLDLDMKRFFTSDGEVIT